MRKALKMVLCSALLVAALFTFSAFTSAPTGMNPHTAHAASATTMSPSYTCPLPVLYPNANNPSSAVKLAQQSVMYWYNTSSTGFKTWTRTFDGGMYAHDFPIAIDGIYGFHSVEAIADFQLYYGLDDDGIVGPKTWHALGHC